MVMVGDIGVEIGSRSVDRDLAQKPRLGELMQRIVDGRERHPDACRYRLRVQVFRRYVAVALGENHAAELDPLPRRAQPGMAKLGRHALLKNQAVHAGGRLAH
jgi:hypothetical protein